MIARVNMRIDQKSSGQTFLDFQSKALNHLWEDAMFLNCIFYLHTLPAKKKWYQILLFFISFIIFMFFRKFLQIKRKNAKDKLEGEAT